MVEKIDRLGSARFTHARRPKKVLHGKTARIEQVKQYPDQEMMHLRS